MVENRDFQYFRLLLYMDLYRQSQKYLYGNTHICHWLSNDLISTCIVLKRVFGENGKKCHENL